MKTLSTNYWIEIWSPGAKRFLYYQQDRSPNRARIIADKMRIEGATRIVEVRHIEIYKTTKLKSKK